MNPAPNLILIGPMGAGKTCIGRRLAERFTLDFVDADQAIVDAAGASIPAIFEHSGEAGFRQYERQALQTLLRGRNQLVSTGGGAVLDPDNRAIIAERGFVVYLRVSVAGQLERLARDRTRPLLQRPDREQVLHEMAALRDPLYRALADLALDTDLYTPAEATAQLVLRLAAQWQRQDPPA
ncbi:shikimate kinase [Stenotrophomonas rhizophila]|jgi:shikimate kinase|uniref:shikimate kinase n=1 Tax=Stenotrophomonas rhizophila TaxID=216778 RepID=UPI000456C9B5|nr:shikimate kinase [Stenotrophomonas rhizophila]AHY58101.1 shikimate kinase [Stenotrophomonas rhizophila]MDY0954811.1 shikimate kinase [Stenotrophomonas rhizophila]TKK03765.1 shikimate kinase [Stenotrophomonas rhizophila]